MNIQFAPRTIPTVATILVVGLTGYLGAWQQGRAETKRALQLEFDQRHSMPELVVAGDMPADGLQFRRALASGEWQPTSAIFLDNKVEGGRAGYHFLAPLKLANDNYLLVNLGWVARSPAYPRPPAIDLPSGRHTIPGMLAKPGGRFLELAGTTIDGSVWQNITIERYRQATGLAVLPYVLLASQTLAPLKVVTEKPDAGVEKHVEYMMTWYALAATAIILWVALNVHRMRPAGAEGSNT